MISYEQTDNKHVGRGRKPFAIPRGMKVDWNDTNAAIAEQLNVSPLTVMKLRLRLGKKPLPRGRPFEQTTLPASKMKEAREELAAVRKTVNALYELFGKK